jgi:hypothetical protein
MNNRRQLAEKIIMLEVIGQSRVYTDDERIRLARAYICDRYINLKKAIAL